MFALILVAQLQSAQACDGPTHTTQCHLDGDEERHRPAENLDVRILGEATAMPHSTYLGGSVRLSGKRDGWLGLEGRVAGERRTMGRIAAGFDVLGSGDWDLRVGLFMGHVGAWQTRDYRYLSVGTDLGLGVTKGRVGGEYRFLGGKRPRAAGLRTEHDISVSYRVVDDLRVHGHWLAMTDEPGEVRSGVGLGASWTF